MNKYALVTGASSGIGFALSKRLAELGHNILLVSNQQERLQTAADEIKQTFGVETAKLFIDLARQDAAQEVFDFCQNNNFNIDILINNAGMFFFKNIYQTDLSQINKILNLHVITPSLLCKLFAAKMRENGSGYIMNISSIAAYMKLPYITFYGATKAFLKNFSRGLYEELCPHNISVTTVCPGAVGTDLYDLSDKNKQLGVKIGIIIPPEKLAKKAIDKMFKHKRQYIPTPIVNRPAIWLTANLPHRLIQASQKKINKIMKNIYERKI
ncbi:MAG: SDR family NAD(P)-dependent oxidoreductase [Bacteroidales bacterium]|jgi:short-subunit dehydrogenase|nr:SDR family NAD(P)-dependent oxidoreductase [Bacteroidales bacterium]